MEGPRRVRPRPRKAVDSRALVDLLQVPSHHSDFLWRLVIARLGSLREIEEEWSIVDALDAHTALDLEEDIPVLVEKLSG